MEYTMRLFAFVALACLYHVFLFNQAHANLVSITNVGEFEIQHNVYGLAFSVDGKYLWSGGNELDKNGFVLTCWDVQNRRMHAKIKTGLQAQIQKIVVSPDGADIAIGDLWTRVVILSADGKVRNHFRHLENGETSIKCLAYVSKEEVFSVGFRDFAHKWGVVTNRCSTYGLDSYLGLVNAADV